MLTVKLTGCTSPCGQASMHTWREYADWWTLGMPMRDYLDQVDSDEKTYPEHGQHHSLGRTPFENLLGSRLSTSVPCSFP